MNNPLLYPFLAICGVLALAFGVWCYFIIKERRDKQIAEQVVDVIISAVQTGLVPDVSVEIDAEGKRRFKKRVPQTPRDCDVPQMPERSYGSLYRHHGHRHAPRPENRADRRMGMPKNEHAKPSPRDFDFPEFYYGERS